MSRRSRAIVFGALALVCAGLAAAVAGGYRGGVEAQLGELRSVLVARAEISGRRAIQPGDAAKLLESRRVPARFVPPDVLSDPNQVVGRSPIAAIPPGAYVTAGQLRLPADRRRSQHDRLGPGREAVEITVTGAEALAAGGDEPEGTTVDVVVTTEPRSGGGPGRTYVAADGVRLLRLVETGAGDDAGGLGPTGPAAWVATLAASRSQALHLIHAHNYARELRLIAAG
ncbi:MAG: SAF domain-containing protein [bacterium]